MKIQHSECKLLHEVQRAYVVDVIWNIAYWKPKKTANSEFAFQ